jgi:BON domain
LFTTRRTPSTCRASSVARCRVLSLSTVPLSCTIPLVVSTSTFDTNKGTVYLTGNVENMAVKARATELAQQVSGVREVVNNLKIQ